MDRTGARAVPSRGQRSRTWCGFLIPALHTLSSARFLSRRDSGVSPQETCRLTTFGGERLRRLTEPTMSNMAATSAAGSADFGGARTGDNGAGADPGEGGQLEGPTTGEAGAGDEAGEGGHREGPKQVSRDDAASEIAARGHFEDTAAVTEGGISRGGICAIGPNGGTDKVAPNLLN